jgi:arylsulfatase A-like enzyme
MLAEVFRDAGHDTAAFSENVWITRHFNMTQGFGHDVWATGETLLPSLDAWLAGRTGDRPFLVFVNIVDAHSPYTVRPANAHLPPGATAEDAKRIPQSEETYFCNRDADPRALDVLRGLYLGDVAAADAKLAAVRARLEPRAGASPLVTVVTSDHGEAFGEHALYGHLVGLHEVLLRVPLVVHGLPGTSPATIDVPVPLGNLAPSILGWADLAVPAAMGGTPVAVARGGPAAGSPFVADWYDPLDDAEPAAPSSVSPDGDIARLVPEAARGLARRVRARCTPEQRAFGARHAFFQWPRKLIAYDAGPAELYDVVADPGERRDLAATERALVRELVAGHARFVAPAPPAHAGGGAGAAPRDQRDVLENLKALGYIDD